MPESLTNDIYRIDIYEPREACNSHRFLLGRRGTNPLFVIGLNPSTADKEKSDRTITRVRKYSSENHDGFVMINLCAQRTPYPTSLADKYDEQLRSENLRQIRQLFSQFSSLSILAAWGNNIQTREYLFPSLTDIARLADGKPVTWRMVGDTPTRSGHPRHPGRGYYQPLHDFDIQNYLISR